MLRSALSVRGSAAPVLPVGGSPRTRLEAGARRFAATWSLRRRLAESPRTWSVAASKRTWSAGPLVAGSLHAPSLAAGRQQQPAAIWLNQCRDSRIWVLGLQLYIGCSPEREKRVAGLVGLRI